MKNFAGINFRESPILKDFAGINFRESTFSGVKKGIYFREFGQNSRNSRNFLPAKISSLKVDQVKKINDATRCWRVSRMVMALLQDIQVKFLDFEHLMSLLFSPMQNRMWCNYQTIDGRFFEWKKMGWIQNRSSF